jgi:hypothetical protein
MLMLMPMRNSMRRCGGNAALLPFGRSDKLYVTLASLSASGILILRPDGTEVARLGNATDPFFPYDSPANLAFSERGSLLVTNHAFAIGIPEHCIVLDVFVDERGDQLAQPESPKLHWEHGL